MSDLATALSNVDAFEADSYTSVAWQLERSYVLQRLRELLGNPDLLNQRGLNACAPAVFFRTWLRRDPVAAAEFACTLLRDGSARIGSLAVAPSWKLLGQDYAKLRSVTNSAHPNATPENADWMLLSALRDSENLWFDYAGEPFTLGDAVAGLTLPSTLAGWFSATNLYSSVMNETTLVSSGDLSRLLGLIPTSDTDVVLFINANAVYDLAPAPGPPVPPNPAIVVPDHFVAMTAPFVEADGSNWVDIEVWTWGRVMHGWQKEPRLLNNYFGVIIATV